MSIQSYPLIKLFQVFIKDSEKGRRLKQDGKKIKSGSIDNYTNCLRLLKLFEESHDFVITIRPQPRYSKKQMQVEKRYWKKFYTLFTSFLYKQGCFDNYVGNIIKCLRTFFNYLEKDKMMPIGSFHKEFIIIQQDVAIITLMPDQLGFLIHNKEFQQCLPEHLQRIKDIFVTGCAVALRYSDLIGIKWQNIEQKNGQTYLAVQSKKTDTITRVRLPEYVKAILEKNAKYKRRRATIFEPISLHRFNHNIRVIVEKAGYIEQVIKTRNKKGVSCNLLNPKTNKAFRFCDLVSSHIMRRTAITTMLMNGVSEGVIKKISGHSSNSKSFYRYVNLAQDFMDMEIEKHWTTIDKSSS